MIEYINRRLCDWARWRLSGRLSLMARPSIYFLGQRVHDPDAVRDNFIPFNEIECSRVDVAVRKLEGVLQRAVIESYTRTTTMRLAARACRCSERTLYRRLDRAHVFIREALL